jgi:hypothetical protein
MPSSVRAFCSGASGVTRSSSASTASVMTHGFTSDAPPWTTRWPTASLGTKSSTGSAMPSTTSSSFTLVDPALTVSTLMPSILTSGGTP